MNSEFPDEARDLSRRLDRALPPYTHNVNGTDDDPLVEVAQRLALAPRPVLSGAAQQRIEALLRERALDLQRPYIQIHSRTSHFRPLAWVWRLSLALLVIVVLLGVGAAQVSATSLPGDALYPVKRAFEDARLSLVSTDKEPNLRIELADRRVDEFEALLDHQRVYPRVLDEANDHLDRALNLAARGYGSRAAINRQALSLTHRQTRLIEQAVSLASVEDTQHLQALVARVEVIQDRTTTSGPNNNPPAVLPAHTVTPSPTPQPTETPLPTDTPQPTETLRPPSVTPPPTNTPRFTPTPTGTLSPTRTPSSSNAATGRLPTRTPPGHGATPGLGQNPPGHGGDNPGVGNNGNPPGQDKPPKK